MSRPRARTAKAVLDFFLGHTRGTADWERALRALTLFMVKGHAPKFFAQHRLERVYAAALGRLEDVPRALPPGLAAIDAMSRIDAAWVEWAEGKRPAAPALDEARAFVAMARERDGLLWAWLMGELLAQVGLEARVAIASPRPLRSAEANEEDLYWVTHLILLETRYLSRPLAPGARSAELSALAEAVAPLKVVGEVDLIAEVAFCLQAGGVPTAAVVEALEPFVSELGQVGKETGYSGAHAAAAVLVALAGAVDRGA